jgi:hypothetical protein
MNPLQQHADGVRGKAGPRRLLPLLAGALLVVLIGVLYPRSEKPPSAPSGTHTTTASESLAQKRERSAWTIPGASRRRSMDAGVKRSPEEIVAGQFSLLVRNRRELLHKMAREWNLEVPADFEHFLDAAETGQWEKVQELFNLMKTNRQNEAWTENSHRLWPAVLETYGVAEIAHDWPAQQLLDYGDAVLGSLRPGTVYAGGTDPGRFIPTLLNETADGPERIVLTQNALADSTYLDHVRFLYAGRINALSPEDSQKAFDSYLADARKRFEHDRDFPDEPAQLRPGESIQITEGKTSVAGQVAVMAINDKLFQMLMEKNPETSFAIEQSFPFQSTYTEATPVGPIMELRVSDDHDKLTAERATQSVDYWTATTQQLLSDPAVTESHAISRAYAKMAVEQAALFQDRKFPAEAEQLFQMATELSPGNPEVTFRYINLLLGQGRLTDATAVAENAFKVASANESLRDLLEHLKRMNSGPAPRSR